jgi:hypothetical protein
MPDDGLADMPEFDKPNPARYFTPIPESERRPLPEPPKNLIPPEDDEKKKYFAWVSQQIMKDAKDLPALMAILYDRLKGFAGHYNGVYKPEVEDTICNLAKTIALVSRVAAETQEEIKSATGWRMGRTG